MLFEKKNRLQTKKKKKDLVSFFSFQDGDILASAHRPLGFNRCACVRPASTHCLQCYCGGTSTRPKKKKKKKKKRKIKVRKRLNETTHCIHPRRIRPCNRRWNRRPSRVERTRHYDFYKRTDPRCNSAFLQQITSIPLIFFSCFYSFIFLTKSQWGETTKSWPKAISCATNEWRIATR